MKRFFLLVSMFFLISFSVAGQSLDYMENNRKLFPKEKQTKFDFHRRSWVRVKEIIEIEFANISDPQSVDYYGDKVAQYYDKLIILDLENADDTELAAEIFLPLFRELESKLGKVVYYRLNMPKLQDNAIEEALKKALIKAGFYGGVQIGNNWLTGVFKKKTIKGIVYFFLKQSAVTAMKKVVTAIEGPVNILLIANAMKNVVNEYSNSKNEAKRMWVAQASNVIKAALLELEQEYKNAALSNLENR